MAGATHTGAHTPAGAPAAARWCSRRRRRRRPARAAPCRRPRRRRHRVAPVLGQAQLAGVGVLAPADVVQVARGRHDELCGEERQRLRGQRWLVGAGAAGQRLAAGRRQGHTSTPHHSAPQRIAAWHWCCKAGSSHPGRPRTCAQGHLHHDALLRQRQALLAPLQLRVLQLRLSGKERTMCKVACWQEAVETRQFGTAPRGNLAAPSGCQH